MFLQISLVIKDSGKTRASLFALSTGSRARRDWVKDTIKNIVVNLNIVTLMAGISRHPTKQNPFMIFSLLLLPLPLRPPVF